MNILIINGPNLNFLGSRNTSVYGKETLDEINKWITKKTQEKKYNLKFFQSNHEGDIIDIFQNELSWYDGVIINPGALTHYYNPNCLLILLLLFWGVNPKGG